MYFPCVRTKLLSINALAENLSEHVSPVLEICRVGSKRRGTIFGDAESVVSLIAEKIGSHRFFLDISDNEDDRISSYHFLLDEKNGLYPNWVRFVAQNFYRNCVPILQFSPVDEEASVRVQLETLLADFDFVGVRIPIAISEDDLTPIRAVFDNRDIYSRTFFFADVGQFDADSFNFAKNFDDWALLDDFSAVRTISQLSRSEALPRVVTLSTSMPKSFTVSVKDEVEGVGFFEGTRPLTDRFLSDEIKHRFKNIADIEYGDYAGVNRDSATGGGAAWIPRIDIPSLDSIHFVRQRTARNVSQTLAKTSIAAAKLPRDNKEALTIVARHIVESGKISDVVCGKVADTIRDAAEGKPTRSDAGFWTSVRVMEHIAKNAAHEI